MVDVSFVKLIFINVQFEKDAFPFTNNIFSQSLLKIYSLYINTIRFVKFIIFLNIKNNSIFNIFSYSF